MYGAALCEMTVINGFDMGLDSIPISITLEPGLIPLKSILRRLGYPPRIGEMQGAVRGILDSELEKARDLIEPKCVLRCLKIIRRTDDSTGFELHFRVKSQQVTRLLKDAMYGTFFFVTIGGRLEQEVERLSTVGELTNALILDAIGSETVDSYADQVHRNIIQGQAEKNGFRITPRFSPGFGDWPLPVQKELAALCEAGRIGIALNESFLMIPRKSVSAVFGLV